MSWRYGAWTVEHALPIGVATRAADGDAVRAGDVIASGTTFGPPVRLSGARRVGVNAGDLARVLRVSAGAEVPRGAILARTGRRFARALTAPFDGRLVHVRIDGDLEFAPVVARWHVRSAIDGTVARANDTEIVVTGSAWRLQGLAAYGPDATGDLAVVADGAASELAPQRVDVGLGGRIVVGGGRSGAEAIARAHACGVAAVVTGAVPAQGLRAVFGDDVDAHGTSVRVDMPTVLCLAGFGASTLPATLYAPFASLAGSRAAIHTASARLFVFADAGAVAVPATPPSVALAADWGAVRAFGGQASLAADTRFASEIVAAAVTLDDAAVPSANVVAFDAAR